MSVISFLVFPLFYSRDFLLELREKKRKKKNYRILPGISNFAESSRFEGHLLLHSASRCQQCVFRLVRVNWSACRRDELK